MKIKLSSDCTGIDWLKLVDVFRRAPLGERDPEKLRSSFMNSAVTCFVWDHDELVGAGRAISDGVAYTAIFDVVLLPEFQGRGIGKQIMKFLQAEAKAPNVILHAVPGKEEFYRKLGYRRMRTAMASFANPQIQHERGYIE